MANFKFTLKIENLLISVLLFAICYLLFTIEQAQAQGLSLAIDPPIIQIEADAPSNPTAPITVQNASDRQVSLKILFKLFKASDQENGQILFLGENESFPGDPLILERVKITDPSTGSGQVTQLTLSPGQSKDLKLDINIPRQTPSSDYYFSIIFLTESPNSKLDTANSQLTGGIATNVLLSVKPGQTTGTIAQFSSPFFAESGPIPFTVRVKNTSNHFITPIGEITIKNLLGQTVGRLDLQPVNVLSNSIRTIPSDTSDTFDTFDTFSTDTSRAYWNEKFVLGPYIATLKLSLSENGPVFKRDIFFLAAPWRILAVVLALTIIVILISLRVKERL